jgi:hypothetical protein
MGIVNTIRRSGNDLVKPKAKTYWGCDLEIELKDVKTITEKTTLTPAEKKITAYELSGIEPIEQVIILDNRNTIMGRLTTSQIKEILDDMGFNVDTILSGAHNCDFSAVMNINGFMIPGWEWIVKIGSRWLPELEKLLLTKLAPGRERLHVRIYELNDGKWLIAAHTDWNWMNLNPVRVFKAHVGSGAGNYKLGTVMMYELMKSFKKYMVRNQVFDYAEIARVCRWVYYQMLADSLKK